MTRVFHFIGMSNKIMRLKCFHPSFECFTFGSYFAEITFKSLHMFPIFEIRLYLDIVCLTVTDDNLADEAVRDEVASGWSAVLLNLKSLIETDTLYHRNHERCLADRYAPGVQESG